MVDNEKPVSLELLTDKPQGKINLLKKVRNAKGQLYIACIQETGTLCLTEK